MSAGSIFNDLCRYPKWQVDNVKIANNSIAISGWALPFRDAVGGGEILLNGAKSSEFKWTISPDIEKVFPHVVNAGRSRFSATYNFTDLPYILRMSYSGFYTHEPFNKWMDIYFPVTVWNEKQFNAPESARLIRTQGDDSLFRYVTYGFTVACQMELMLQTYFGANLSAYNTICDWGVGCGRVAQMVHYIAPKSRLIGIDIDADNVDWCKNNLPFGSYEAVALDPPTRLGEETVDLIYGISVFTHLTLKSFKAWIDELARILRPGGVALVTINSAASLVRRSDNKAELIERVLRTGFDDGSPDMALAGKIESKDYYRGTFVMHSKAVALFCEKFKVRDILRQANGASQDMLVCEKR